MTLRCNRLVFFMFYNTKKNNATSKIGANFTPISRKSIFINILI